MTSSQVFVNDDNKSQLHSWKNKEHEDGCFLDVALWNIPEDTLTVMRNSGLT
jgi:hypothetical protein